MTWFVNYQIAATLPIADRGLAYGDGVFETIHVVNHTPISLDLHLQRLKRGLKRLVMPLTNDQHQQLLIFLSRHLTTYLPEQGVIKIIVTRGEGGRGYAPPEKPQHNILIGLLPAPDYQQQQSQGVQLALSPIRLSNNPFLAGIKHLNRLENVLAKQQLPKHAFEALMLDQQGHVIECIQSNIFWFRNGHLYTPQLNESGVSGTYRQRILSQQQRFSVYIARFTLADLQQADEVFITNSLMKIVPVTAIAEHTFAIGHHTRTLQLDRQLKDHNDVS